MRVPASARRATAAVVALVALGALGGGWLACSSATRPPAEGSPAVDGGARDSAAGATDSATTKDAAPDAGAEEAAGEDAAPDAAGGDAAGGSDASDSGVPVEAGDGGGIPPPPTAVCSATASWGAGTLLGVSTSSDDVLDAITPDELTIAWTEGTGGTAMLLVADRATSAGAFGAPQVVAAGSFSTARATLGHDGLTLVVVNADGQG
ncbi:MAG TPA: hypothetical protein VHS09_09860, partial [Polyangiaceae bacterium]|nr:hypothetical protein [Polyangiaceae bacterium]